MLQIERQCFDFHSCFYYAEFKDLDGDQSNGRFMLHDFFIQAKDFSNDVPVLKYPLILLHTINASIFLNCFCEVFQLSQRFSKIQHLNLRGCDSQTVSKQKLMRILKSCDQIQHLNLSFMAAVDDEVVSKIGEVFQPTLISLELRACSKITDAGLVGFCERISGFYNIEGITDHNYGQLINSLQNKSSLAYLNLADVNQLTNLSMKSISYNLLQTLQDLCIWGCYNITQDGFMDMCQQGKTKSSKLNRINTTGCHQISDSNLKPWLDASFCQGIKTYREPDDFGKGINY